MDLRIKKNDLYLIGILLGLALACLLLMQVLKDNGSRVVIYVRGEEVESFPIDRDRTYMIRTEQGMNELVIENGSAYLKDADCPDRLCVRMGRIRYDGQTIVCLPHKVVIAVEGGEKETGSGEEEIDIVAR